LQHNPHIFAKGYFVSLFYNLRHRPSEPLPAPAIP
jgi:hypothetical protein